MEASQKPREPQLKRVALDNLVPNPLNANSMSSDLREKLLVNIRRTGRYPLLVVRPHPIEDGKFEVLDGHHRIGILRDLGHTDARCDVWDVDDREARLLLATLNRMEGQDIPVRRAELLHELLADMSIEDLSGLIPETGPEIADLQALLEFPTDDIAHQLAMEAADQERLFPRTLSFVVTPEQEELIERAIQIASDGQPGRDLKARGLANIASHFLDAHPEETPLSTEPT